MGRMVQNPNDPKYLRSLLRRARKAAVINGEQYPNVEGSAFTCNNCNEYSCPLPDSLIKEIDKALEVD
jgi:hypothetical protein